MHESAFCFAHDPEHAKEMAEARRVGGLRRRREGALAGAYDLEGFEDVGGLRRVLTIALTDLLGLDNSILRARALITAVGLGAKLLEAGGIAEALEGRGGEAKTTE